MGFHPAHDPEAADEIDLHHLETIEAEVAIVDPVAGLLVPCQVAFAHRLEILRQHWLAAAHEGYAPGPEGS